MINILQDKFTKKVTIGDYKFSIGINRKMAAEAFSLYPKYWELITQSEAFKNLISKNKYNKEELNYEDLEYSDLLKLLEIEEDIEKEAFNIVQYLLPKMIKYANTENPEYLNKPDEYYQNFSNEILEFCKDNEIIFDYFDNENNKHKGVCSAFMEFITQGFINGGKKRKSAVKIILE